MKVAIAYLTKDRVALTEQTYGALRTCLGSTEFDLLWFDGSSDSDALGFVDSYGHKTKEVFRAVRGGADAAIVFALTTMLADSSYTHVGLCENDVLLAPDWYERTMALFDAGRRDGLEVGAVSARTYDDRVLIQRDGYAVMHNLGAGHIVFTRQAAELVLANYRTGWWPDNRAIFSQLSGVDIGRYACFRGNAQWTTCDWHFDAILAQHGLASLGLTPARCDMIGQEPSLEEQGLRLVDREIEHFRNDAAFEHFVDRTQAIRDGKWVPQVITPVHRASMNGGASLIFPHQLTDPVWSGDWRVKWVQGFGGFGWRSGTDGATLQVEVFGPAVFIVSGHQRAAKLTLQDLESGYELTPEVSPAEHGLTQLAVPGGYSLRSIRLTAGEGLIFYGIQCVEPQPVSSRKFDYSSLPPV